MIAVNKERGAQVSETIRATYHHFTKLRSKTMAKDSLTHTVSPINPQYHFQEILGTHLSKAQALIQVAMGDGFLGHGNSIVYHHLWVLSELIEQANILNETLLNAALKKMDSNPV